MVEPKGGWAGALEAATREVFQVMMRSDLEQLEDDSATKTELIAMVGLSGRLAGVLSVHCTADGAAEMAARMLQSEQEESEDTARDAAGEVCNMVAGNFKTKLGAMGDDCMLSVPTIIAGGHCSMTPPGADVHIELPFQFAGAPLRVMLDLRA